MFRLDASCRYQVMAVRFCKLSVDSIDVAKHRGTLPRERFRCVLGMFSSLEVEVLRPT